jgi:hypothetical protein
LVWVFSKASLGAHVDQVVGDAAIVAEALGGLRPAPVFLIGWQCGAGVLCQFCPVSVVITEGWRFGDATVVGIIGESEVAELRVFLVGHERLSVAGPIDASVLSATVVGILRRAEVGEWVVAAEHHLAVVPVVVEVGVARAAVLEGLVVGGGEIPGWLDVVGERVGLWF